MFNSNNSTLPVSIPIGVNGNGGAFGGNTFEDIIALAIVGMIFGWGNGGYGNGGGAYFGENYALISDNATLERKIDGVYAGICDSTFALNNTITNGFASAQNTMTQGFAGLNTALVTQGYEDRIATQGVANTVQNCCCDLKGQIADVNYNIANQANMLDRTVSDKFCQTNFNNATNTRDIIDSQSAGTRAILDKLCQMENNAKDEKIADLQAKNFDLRLSASQEAQNRTLISELGYQCPKPAYVVQPPQQVSFATNCGGVATWGNTGCGCNLYNGTTIA